MRYDTICANCLFASKTNSKKACKFDIIDTIKDHKKISIDENNFYKIENYICKFCMSKSFYEKNILVNKSYDNIDLENYIKNKNQIKYYLIINTNDNYDLEKLYDNIGSLDIQPKLTSIMTHKFSTQKIESLLNIFNQQKYTFKYRFHNFIEDVDKNEALFTVMDTTSKTNNFEYLLILDVESLDSFVTKKSILQINYIINVIQPDSNVLKKDINGNFDTLFITIENYKGITKNINQSLELGLDTFENLAITYYD